MAILKKLFSRRSSSPPPERRSGERRRIQRGRRLRIEIKDYGGRLAYSDDEAVRTADEIIAAIRDLPPGGHITMEIFLVDDALPAATSSIIVPKTNSQAAPSVQLNEARREDTGEFARSRADAMAAIHSYQEARARRGDDA